MIRLVHIDESSLVCCCLQSELNAADVPYWEIHRSFVYDLSQ